MTKELSETSPVESSIIFYEGESGVSQKAISESKKDKPGNNAPT